MKILPILLLIALSGFAQTDLETSDIQIAFEEYRYLIEEKEYNQAFDYYHPSFLKYIPKAALEKEFAKLNNNPNYTYTVRDSKLVTVTTMFEKDSVEYLMLRYGANTHLKFHKNTSAKSKERIKSHFKDLYGANYSYSEENEEITTYKEQELVGINEGTWKFVIYKDKLKPYMHLWVPNSIMERLLQN